MTLQLLVLQVTLWLLLGVVVYLCSLRQGPRAAARCLSLVFGGVGLLSAAACLPLPGWPLAESWAYFQQQSASPIAALPEPTVTVENSPPAEGGASSASPLRFSLDSLLHKRSPMKATSAEVTMLPPPSFFWETVAILALLACCLVGTVRLFLGLWAVHECKRRSMSLHDDDLRQLCDTLRKEMGIAPTVELRVLEGLGSPATIGWRQPMLLLPTNWRNWSDEERRSVLAHELAHVQAGDYLRWLLAQLATALHGYQPLVHWLLARLHREQELAADQTAARHAGGTAVYLRSLCQLALTQNEGSTPFPARTFLPVRFSLIRRITMLRAWKHDGEHSVSHLRRWCGLTLLLVLGIGVAGLRSVGGAQEKQTPPPPLPMVQVKDLPLAPFVLNYVHKEGVGVVAIRPAAVVSHPSMKLGQFLFNHQFKEILKQMLGNDGPCFGVQQIEQVVLNMQVTPKTKETPGSMGLSLNLLRLIPGERWQPFLAARFPKVETVKHGNGSYLRLPANAFPLLAPDFKGEPICAFLPDERTLVMADEGQIRLWLKDGPPAPSAHFWSGLWQGTDAPDCIIAAGVNCQQMRKLMGLVDTQDPKLMAMVKLLEQSEALAFTCNASDKVKFRFTIRGTETANLKTFAEAGQACWQASCDNIPVTLPAGKGGKTEKYVDEASRLIGVTHEFPIPLGSLLLAVVPEMFTQNSPQAESEHVFQTEVKLVEVPVTVMQQYLEKHLKGPWKYEGMKEMPSFVLSPAETKVLLEMVQADQRCKVLTSPIVQSLPAQIAVVEIGQSAGSPTWRCKLSLTYKGESELRLEIASEYKNAENTLGPVTAEAKAKHKRLTDWKIGAYQPILPGFTLLVLDLLPEKPEPNETTVIILATPTREPLSSKQIHPDVKPPVSK